MVLGQGLLLSRLCRCGLSASSEHVLTVWTREGELECDKSNCCSLAPGWPHADGFGGLAAADKGDRIDRLSSPNPITPPTSSHGQLLRNIVGSECELRAKPGLA